MSVSPSRIASKFLVAADEVWLPDYLGAGAPAADAAMRLIKEIVRDSSDEPTFRTNAKAVAGGLLYHMLRDGANLEDDAKHMWPILDRNAGLHVGGEMWRHASRLYHVVMHGVDPGSKAARALRIAGLGVELLQRTKQPTKAMIINRYFVHKYGDALTAMQPGREKAMKPEERLRKLIDAEMVRTAKSVAEQLANNKAKVLAVIEYILTDVNFHVLAMYAPSSVELTEDEAQMAKGISGGYLQYGVEDAAAFSVALLEAAGLGEMARKFEKVAIRIGVESGLFDIRLGSKKACDTYIGNPNGQGIYPNEIGHGYDEPLAGGTDVMRKLQNQLLHEQGRDPRPESPRLAAVAKPSVPKLRKPLADTVAKVGALLDVVKMNPSVRGDRTLQGKANALKDALDALHSYIDDTYTLE